MFESIYLELTNICDMSCEFCSNAIMERPKKHMDYDLFLHIIDQISANNLTKEILLFGIGETFLYPRLLDAVKYCRDKNLKTSITTNGLILTTDLYQKLFDRGLKALQVSFQDLTEVSFAYRHAKHKIVYDSYYENLIKLIDYHIDRNLSCILTIDVMFCKEHWISGKLWDLPEIKKNTKNARILLRPFIDDMHRIAHRHNIKCHLNNISVGFFLRALNEFKGRQVKIMKNVVLKITPLCPDLFNTRKKLLGPLGKKIKLVKATKGSCIASTKSVPLILSDGSFVPCCIDAFGELSMGKISGGAGSLISIIENKRYRNFREKFKNNNITSPVCQECKGRLIYRNPLFQILYSVRSFNVFAFMATFFEKSNRFLRKHWWEKLSEQNRHKIKRLLKTMTAKEAARDGRDKFARKIP